ncbi:metalloregulator ArsR/SmtB family transcription factor [Aquihabitans sp. G128]|uniref:ArsR/SmtB family transcription factor n=1 Tax=Aquihabitans sp. G128 TaxID=2849779 RepID=UPI001C248188|nr:metalloregulator ArsR/SmtB family transcription factor [Aquihabitans sp. G128]QXC59219.1 metalloregulator ArsR/SmtB family transcription factor [Aquihabitans sp. G128]
MSSARIPVDAPDVCCPSVTDAPLDQADAEALAHTYAALADPVRLRLLSLIAASGEICSCDLLEPLAKSQPTVSHHTKVLAEAGLITGDKRGRWVHWRIAPARADFVRLLLA